MILFISNATFLFFRVLVTMLLISKLSHAYLTSSFDMNIGQSSFSAKTSNDSRTIGSFSTIEMNYCLRNSSMGLAYAMSFFEVVNSKEGALALTRFSVGPRYYPMGMNGNKVIIDNDVVAKIWKATPYIGGSMGLTNISTQVYNASMFDLGFRFGVEIPLTPRLLLNAQYGFSESFGSSSVGDAKNISYSGTVATVGIIISGVGEM